MACAHALDEPCGLRFGHATRAWSRLLFACAMLAFAGAAQTQADAQARARPQATEPEVKAAYLYRFASYIEWPASAFAGPEAPFVIGVMGADAVQAPLARIVAGRRVGTHPVVLRQVREGDALNDVHLLFVGRALADHLADIASAALAAGALVVTDSAGALEQGSAINFVAAGDRVGFEVSLAAAERSGHRISSRMLALARRVVGKPS